MKKDIKRSSLKVLGGITQSGRNRHTQTFSLLTLSALAGISRRQISYWSEMGMVRPILRLATKNKSEKATFWYSEEEAAKLLVFADMKRRGFSLGQVKEVWRRLLHDSKSITTIEKYILTDGVMVMYADTDREAIELQKRHRPMLLVDTSDHLQRLSRSVVNTRSR